MGYLQSYTKSTKNSRLTTWESPRRDPALHPSPMTHLLGNRSRNRVSVTQPAGYFHCVLSRLAGISYTRLPAFPRRKVDKSEQTPAEYSPLSFLCSLFADGTGRDLLSSTHSRNHQQKHPAQSPCNSHISPPPETTDTSTKIPSHSPRLRSRIRRHRPG